MPGTHRLVSKSIHIRSKPSGPALAGYRSHSSRSSAGTKDSPTVREESDSAESIGLRPIQIRFEVLENQIQTRLDVTAHGRLSQADVSSRECAGQLQMRTGLPIAFRSRAKISPKYRARDPRPNWELRLLIRRRKGCRSCSTRHTTVKLLVRFQVCDSVYAGTSQYSVQFGPVLLQQFSLRLACTGCEQPCGLALESLTNHVMTADILNGRNPNPCSHTGPAFEEPFVFESLEGLRDWRQAHLQFPCDGAPGHQIPERQSSALDSLQDRSVRTIGEAYVRDRLQFRRFGRCFWALPDQSDPRVHYIAPVADIAAERGRRG